MSEPKPFTLTELIITVIITALLMTCLFAEYRSRLLSTPVPAVTITTDPESEKSDEWD